MVLWKIGKVIWRPECHQRSLEPTCVPILPQARLMEPAHFAACCRNSSSACTRDSWDHGKRFRKVASKPGNRMKSDEKRWKTMEFRPRASDFRCSMCLSKLPPAPMASHTAPSSFCVTYGTASRLAPKASWSRFESMVPKAYAHRKGIEKRCETGL